MPAPKQIHILSIETPLLQLMQKRFESRADIRLTAVDTQKKFRLTDGGAVLFHIYDQDSILRFVEVTELLSQHKVPYTLVMISSLKGPAAKFIAATPSAFVVSETPDAHEMDRRIVRYVKQQELAKTHKPETLVYRPNLESIVSRAEPSKPPPARVVTPIKASVPMSTGKKKSSPFEEFKTPEERTKALMDGVNSKAQVVLSPFGSKFEMKAHLYDREDKSGRLYFQLTGNPQEIAKWRKEITGKKIAVTLSLKQSRIFFATIDHEVIRDSAFVIANPKQMFYVQRRGDFRVGFDARAHWLEADAQTKQAFEMVDVSVSGLAINCTQDDLVVVKQAILDGHFNLEGLSIKIPKLNFRHARLLTKRGGQEIYRVGFRFEGVDARTQKILANFVERKCRAYFESYVVSDAA